MAEFSTVYVIPIENDDFLVIVKDGARVTQVFAVSGNNEHIIELPATSQIATAFNSLKNTYDHLAIKAAYFASGAQLSIDMVAFAVKAALSKIARDKETAVIEAAKLPEETAPEQEDPPKKTRKRKETIEQTPPEQS